MSEATGGIVTGIIHSNATGACLILERYAFRLGGECSILLSYGDICNFIEQASRLGGVRSILLS